MANSKISALTSATTPLAGTETLPVVQSSTTKQVSVANLTAGRSVATGPLTVTGTTDLNGDVGILGATPGIYPRVTNTDLFLSMRGTGNLVVQNTSGVEKATFLANGDVRVAAGNVIIGTAAKGINFTANTPAAGMTSQLLNWYEEGTWTPNQGGGLTVVGAFSSSGRYTRIGRQVTVTAKLSAATSISVSSVGILLTNLPFAALGSISLGQVTDNSATVGTSCGVLTTASTNTLYALEARGATTNIFVQITYFV